MLATFLSGFGLGLSLILAIGAQNAFVLRQGLRGEYVLPVVLTCAFSDAVLISAGIAGFGAVIGTVPWVLPVFRWGGAVFLIVYGARAAWSAWCGGAVMRPDGEAGGLRRAVLTCLALTWLNPHVYLDTVILLGAIGAQSPAPSVFGAGAVAASFVFFASLGYGAASLRPMFARPGSWRALDVGVALVMWAIAAKLLLSCPAACSRGAGG
ncbi:Arginine exporter protein ArgO [Jannaschia seosinensis]|uniref:Arginine exporter protein ArgO n=1 Tax=Jannaschia seosinensis TaxID=313367 RepID=A0A0M7BEJ8_9RHOB|nr:LysE/ArgO family amino acid transporter [Jannaschia seosinensis]CUH40254.1 Arginine exporter protein ArgO [Jannaschia seosinensis]